MISSLYFDVCQGRFCPEWGGSKLLGAVELEGNYLQSRNKQDGMGQKSGRNGAPAPQSRVSLSELKPGVQFSLLECVRSFLLVVLRIRSRPFSTGLRSRAYLSARCARAANPSRILHGMSRGDKIFCARLRDDCADVFATSKNGTRRNYHQNEVARASGLPGEAGCVHSRVHPDTEETELGTAQSGACPADECD